MTKSKFALYFWSAFFVLLFGYAIFWFFYFRYIEYTDDAYVQGNQVYITPLHPGFVTAIHTDDSFLVKQGQLIVSLDTTDAKIALEKASEELAQAVRYVCELIHQVTVYAAEIDFKTAKLIQNAQDYIHREGVFRAQGVSIEEYEHALAALRSEYASLEMSKALYQKTVAIVQNTTIASHPLVVAAADAVRSAWVRLYRCNIYAPVEGLVAQRTIQVGMWVQEGQPLMSVIPLDQIWVNANYKETQLKRMRIGQKVDIRTDLWGFDALFEGTIVGLPGGAGNAFSLLPPQNLSGNWIKIVQRLPVRLSLNPEQIKTHPLRLGLSCEVVVDTRYHQEGKIVPDTTAGSPSYITPIFAEEEKGDPERIASIIEANLDPTLSSYLHTPPHLARASIELSPILEQALLEDEEFEQQVKEYK